MTGKSSGRLTDNAPGRVEVVLLALATGLLPLQIWPQMPLPGMQLSDGILALAFLCFVVAVPELPLWSVASALAGFALGVVASALAGGWNVKLLGHLELGGAGLDGGEPFANGVAAWLPSFLPACCCSGSSRRLCPSGGCALLSSEQDCWRPC